MRGKSRLVMMVNPRIYKKLSYIKVVVGNHNKRCMYVSQRMYINSIIQKKYKNKVDISGFCFCGVSLPRPSAAPLGIYTRVLV